MKENIKNLLKKIDSKYGLLITNNNKIIYEKYKNNNKNTKFRIFSCSKPITALAIFILAQQNKLKLTDTINKFCINIPYNNIITINHLLYHSSGVYDFSSELYYKLNPKKLFNKILEKNKTKFVDFETTIQEINKNKPYYKPNKNYLKNSYFTNWKNYNNTGYDLLGYIIYVASGMKTDEFIKKYIFKPLKMNHSTFQHEEDKFESNPYESKIKIGIKEEQNWFCGNAFISCTLRDYNKFLFGYEKLLNKKYLKKYQKLYYFGERKDKKYKYFWHFGGGDFNHLHSKGKEDYFPLSRTEMISFFNKNKKINIILSENYVGKNGFISNNFENWNDLIDIVVS